MTATDTSIQWFISRDGCEYGPLSSVDLASMAKQERLHSSDLIWCNGLPDWVEAGSVTGLLPSPVHPQSASPLGFTEALAQQSDMDGAAPAAGRRPPDIEPEEQPGADAWSAPPLTHVPHLARSSKRAAEASAFALWHPEQIGRTRDHPKPVPPDILRRMAADVPRYEGPGKQGHKQDGAERAGPTPGSVESALAELQNLRWEAFIEIVADAFERMHNMRRHSQGEVDMRDLAKTVLGGLPTSVEVCVALSVGAQGFERFMDLIGDWLGQQIGEHTPDASIHQLLRSDVFHRQFRGLFEDFRSRLLAPLTEPPATALAPGAQSRPPMQQARRTANDDEPNGS